MTWGEPAEGRGSADGGRKGAMRGEARRIEEEEEGIRSEACVSVGLDADILCGMECFVECLDMKLLDGQCWCC